MPGKLTIYIGPNGYGKTTKLDEEFAKKPINETIILKSEILLENELKDLDKSKSMECFLDTLFFTEEIDMLKSQIHQNVNNNIEQIRDPINKIVDKILSLNDSKNTTKKDFILPTREIEYKKILEINKKVFESIGSGQKMLLLLELVLRSNKKYIFLDEPEKYMQPSLMKILGEKIRELIVKEKEVYIATHSPKLLCFLEFNLNSINILNEKNGSCKKIDLHNILNVINKEINLYNNLTDKFKKYFELENLEKLILEIHRYSFFDALFSKKVILCEGINDKFFIEKVLRDNNKQFEDYAIFSTFGKPNIPIFLKIFDSLGIKTQFYFDADLETKKQNVWNNKLNEYFHINYPNKYYEFNPTIEKELNFAEEKNDTLDFINYLNKFSFANSKYLIEDINEPLNTDNNETN